MSSVLVTRNIALRKEAFMLTEYAHFVAGIGVDGDEVNFFHTDVGADTWWAVDLGETDTRVTAVRVVNRKTCGEFATRRDWTLVTP